MAGEPDVPINVPVGPPVHDRIYDYSVAPQQVAPSPLHAVAEALAPLSSDLASLGATLGEQQKKKDAAQAEKDFWNQNADGANKALADGTLPHDKSPAYMDAWGANAGLNDALRLHQSIGPEYDKLDKTTADPQAFDKWFFPLAKGSANPAMEQNEGYAKAFGAGVQRLHAELSGRYVTDRSDAVKNGAQQEFTAAVGNQINVQWPTGTSPVDSVALGAQLDQIRQKALAAGMDPAFVEKSIIDVVSTKALDHKSESILPVLTAMTRNPSDPTSAKLAETEYGAAKTLEASKAVQTLLIQDRDRQQTQQKYEDEQSYKTAVTGIVGEWARGNINYAPTPQQIADASKHDPLFPTKLAELRKNVLANDTVEDPAAKVTLYEDLLAKGGGQQSVMDAIGHGTLKTAASIKEASEYATMVENYNKGGGAAKITEDPTFKRYVAVIESTSKDPKWVSSVTGGTGVTIGGRTAVNDLTAAAMNWQMQHPGAGPIERQKFLSELGEGVMKGFGGNDAAGAQMHPYARPPEVQTELPSPATPTAPTGRPTGAPAPSPGLPPQPARPAPAGSPAAPAGSGAIDTPDKALAAIKAMPDSPKFEDLPRLGVAPAVIQELNAAATARGVTPQQLLDAVHAKASGQNHTDAAPADNEATVQRASYAPEEGAVGNPLSFQLPGGGRIDLHGVDPGVAQQVNHMVAQLARLAPGGDAAAPQPTVAHPQATGDVDQNRVASMDALPVHEAIEKVAKETGMDPSQLKAMVSIESGGDARAGTGSYHGLLQLSQDEFAKHGGTGDINDPEANLRAGVASIQEKAAKFKDEFGRDPSVTEQYLMHQQGEGGLRAHEANPQGLAWKNMASTAEGRAKGDAWAKQAVWGNVPKDMKPLFGSVDNMTSAEFIAVWAHKLQGVPFNTALHMAQTQQQQQQEETRGPGDDKA